MNPEARVDKTPDCWDRSYAAPVPDTSDVERMLRRVAFRLVKGRLLDRFGTLAGLRTIEVGAGLGRMSLGLCREGAETTLLDSSPMALAKACELFGKLGLGRPATLPMDLLAAEDAEGVEGLNGRFDVVMSFGLAEHFQSAERERVVGRHFDLARPGGLVVISVPNRSCPTYRLFVWTKRHILRTWGLGLEIPFSRAELAGLAAGRAERWEILSTPLWESVCDHLVDPIAGKLGLKSVCGSKGPGLGVLDRLGYALILVAEAAK